MAHYKLSATLEGHRSDVRSVLLPDPSLAVTASRDGTARFWSRTSTSPPTYDHIEASQGSTFKTCLAYMEPTKDYPKGLVFVGGQDTVIEARRPDSTAQDYAEALMVGHSNQICALDVNSKAGWLVSGSWDSTARLWQIGKWESDVEFDGHGGSVLAVLAYNDEYIITGCADKGIRIFDTRGKVMKQFHGQNIVRALCKLPDGHPSGANFASATNDGRIHLWTLDGGLVSEISGHDGNFVYSLAALPSGEIVSSGEDRTLRIWKGNDCVQAITHPAISVWHVTVCSQNGDIASGASDNKARIFSRDPERHASPEAIRDFEEAVSSSAIPQQTIGDIPTHSPEYLEQRRGNKEGQTVVIKTPDGSLVAHQWSMQTQSWVNIGPVVDSAASSGKTMYQGKEYDYVFDVDIEDGKPPLKLPYNRAQDPYDAATRFLQNNELPISYLEQTAAFIVQNAKGVTIGADSGAPSGPPPPGADPWGTESRYRPGQASSTAAPASGPAPPKTASEAPLSLPQKRYVGIVVANPKGVQKKILELNQKRVASGDKDSALSPSQLEPLNQLFKELENPGDVLADSAALNASLPLTVKIATTWTPAGDRLAGLDLLRQLALRTPELARHDIDGQTLVGVVISSGAFDPEIIKSAPNIAMMAVRIFCNLYLTEAGCALIGRDDTFDNIIQRVKAATHRQNASRMTIMAAATYYVNTAVFLTSPERTNSEASFERGMQVLENALALLSAETLDAKLTGQALRDATENALRFLVAIGTLLVALGEGTIKEFARDEQLYGLERVLNEMKSRGFMKDQRIAGLASQIRGALAE